MARPKKNSKIDFYKVTTLPVVERSARSKEGKRQRDIQQGIKLNTVALNRLGTTLNSLGQSMKELREVNFEIYKAATRQAQDDFKPVFNMPTAPKGRGNQDPKEQTKVKPPSWLESVFELLKMVAAGVIGGLAFKFLSNEENRKKTKKALEMLFDILGVITNFFGTVAYHAIDGLWQLLCNEDASFLERLGGFFKAFVSIGTAFMAIKWLKNPKSLLKDITKAFKGFKGGLKKVAMKLVKKLGKIGIVGLGITALTYLFNRGDGDQEMAKGGKVRKALRASGGFINGPQSGYPVSLDGGNSVSFIGHGLEYVAQKASGGFVIPINTPATQNNPGLMGQRMGEAGRMGYNLGGMMKGFDAGGEVNNKGEQKGQRGKREAKRLERMMKSIGGMIPSFAAGGDMKKMGDGARLVNARSGRCVEGVLNTAQANGAAIGAPNVAAGGDPNNPRGLMAQAVKDFGWTSVNIGNAKKVRSPYGNVNVKVMNKNQWKKSVKQNKIPSGSLIFSTRHSSWDYSGGSSGNDAAIAKRGGRKLWSGHWQAVVDGVGMVYGNATNKVVALVHPKSHKGGYDGSTAPGDGGGSTPMALSGTAKQLIGNDTAFLEKVKKLSAKYQINPADLLGKFASESGLNPAADNGTHVGLIQFSKDSARAVGTTQAALKRMSRAEQMEYVEKYFDYWKLPKGASAGHLYTISYLPAFAKESADYVLAKRGGFSDKNGHHPSSWYDHNAGLDQNNDGQITIAELGERIQKKKREFGITGGESGSYSGDSSSIASDSSTTNGIGPAAALINPLDALKDLAGKFGVDLGENPFAEKPSTGSLGSDEKVSAPGGASGAGQSKEALAATGKAVEKTDAMTGSGHTARSGGSSAESTGSAANLKQAGAGDAPSSSAMPGGATGTASALSPSTNTGGPSGSSGSIMTAQTTATNNAKREKKMGQDALNKAGLEAVQAAEQANAQVAAQVAQANKSVMAASSPKQQFIPTGNGSPKETLVSKMNSANNLMRRRGA
jgi:hypothetical protein